MTFRVMNKVMNNFKKQGNLIVIQSVNENVNPKHSKKFKNAREINLSGVFFYFDKQWNLNEVSMKFAF